MAGAVTNLVQKAVTKTGVTKVLAEGVEALTKNATQSVGTELSQTLSKKATATVGQKIGLLADALPTGQLKIGAKEVDSFEQLAKEMGAGDNPIVAAIKGLFSKAKGRSLTVTSKEAAEGVGKELSVVLAEGEKTLAKVETNSSFLGEVAEAAEKLKLDKQAKKLAAVKDSLTPESLEKLKSFMKECPYPTTKDLKKVFPDCSDEFLNKLLAKMDGAKSVAKEAADHVQQIKSATVVKNAGASKTGKEALEHLKHVTDKLKSGKTPDRMNKAGKVTAAS